jgi:hypothetical protein
MAELTPLGIEATAIRALRGRFPRVGPWVLVRRIARGAFDAASYAYYLASKVSHRSHYSIYSVIRRYDARRLARRRTPADLQQSWN